VIAATDPDLRKFFAHGGKLILYHGWSDQLISPQNTISYYKESFTPAANRLRPPFGCSWLPAWIIAAVARVHLPSTWTTPYRNGSRTTKHLR
jgi:Tannase and feruloyl esterase